MQGAHEEQFGVQCLGHVDIQQVEPGFDPASVFIVFIQNNRLMCFLIMGNFLVEDVNNRFEIKHTHLPLKKSTLPAETQSALESADSAAGHTLPTLCEPATCNLSVNRQHGHTSLKQHISSVTHSEVSSSHVSSTHVCVIMSPRAPSLRLVWTARTHLYLCAASHPPVCESLYAPRCHIYEPSPAKRRLGYADVSAHYAPSPRQRARA